LIYNGFFNSGNVKNGRFWSKVALVFTRIVILARISMAIVQINKKMQQRLADLTYEQCMEKDMSPGQSEVFLIIDEWWKKFGYSPSLREIAYQRNKTGLGNTKRIVDNLVDLGVVKKLKGKGRTVRPVYINFRTIQ
jgi:hypothetical protein